MSWSDVSDILRQMIEEGRVELHVQLSRVGYSKLLQAMIGSPARLSVYVSVCIRADGVAKAKDRVKCGG